MDKPPFTSSEELAGAKLAEQRVAILGLGLMGGSLALALRGKTDALLGIDPDPVMRSLALQRGIVDRVAEHPAELLPEATLVILAAPVRSIISLIYDLPHLHPGQAVVIDLGSTKVDIAQAMTSLPERLSPVGGHPMCGKEINSLVYASEDLFLNAPFVLTHLPNSTQGALHLAQEMIEAIGARPVWCDPAEHDRWVAATSHLPYLLANALAYCTPLELAPLVGSGFRSTVRLAPTSRRMMIDVLITNQGNILDGLTIYRSHLEKLENALAIGDFELLQLLLGQGAQRYDEILPQHNSDLE